MYQCILKCIHTGEWDNKLPSTYCLLLVITINNCQLMVGLLSVCLTTCLTPIILKQIASTMLLCTWATEAVFCLPVFILQVILYSSVSILFGLIFL